MSGDIGWQVEWRSSFREFVGVVVDADEHHWMVRETNDLEIYNLPRLRNSNLRFVKPCIKDYANFVRSKLIDGETLSLTSSAAPTGSANDGADAGSEVDMIRIHDLVIASLSKIQSSDTTVRKQVQSAIEGELHLRAAILRRKNVSHVSDKKFYDRFNDSVAEGNDATFLFYLILF